MDVAEDWIGDAGGETRDEAGVNEIDEGDGDGCNDASVTGSGRDVGLGDGGGVASDDEARPSSPLSAAGSRVSHGVILDLMQVPTK